MNPAVLGRVLVLAAVCRVGLWVWLILVIPWQQALTRYAARLVHQGWAGPLGAAPDHHAEVLVRCLFHPQCGRYLRGALGRMVLGPSTSELLALALAALLLVVGGALSVRSARLAAGDGEPPAERLRRAVRR